MDCTVNAAPALGVKFHSKRLNSCFINTQLSFPTDFASVRFSKCVIMLYRECVSTCGSLYAEHSKFCSDWAQVLLSQGATNTDPFFLKQAIENFKLKVGS